ncbi:MAG: hypothetical protein R3F61_22265 [Myxococcota bacterium]
MHLVSLLIACSGTPTDPGPTPEVEPRRAEAPKPTEIRAPLEAPRPVQPVVIDLDQADPMEVVATKGPGGAPLTALSLVAASRGDGEIEPCG